MSDQLRRVRTNIDDFLATCDKKGIPRDVVGAWIALPHYDPELQAAISKKYRMGVTTTREDCENNVSIELETGRYGVLSTFAVTLNGSGYASRDELAREVTGVLADYGLNVQTRDRNKEAWEILHRLSAQ